MNGVLLKMSLSVSDVLGEYVGGPCEDTCKETLSHVVCNKKTQICECEPGFPVRLGAGYGCAKRKYQDRRSLLETVTGGRDGLDYPREE